jgi:hypothetical protein
MFKKFCKIFIIIFSGVVFFSACKKDNFITSADARLTITADTLKYDTVFVTKGSITQSFKIINENDQKLNLSQVKLMGGNASSFKTNIDGVATNLATNITVAANDSIYVFVTVTINPTASNLPFIIRDSILINYNGNNKYVQLQAYGQNANFINSKSIKTNTYWANTLPYVILGGLQVDSGVTLAVQNGCKIYCHADAPIIINGSLQVNGTKNNEVVFAGDRLDANYVNLPASWPGIFFNVNSKNNFLQFAIIKNAYQAVVVNNPSLNLNPKVIMQQSIIDNAYDVGLLCSNTSVNVNNSLITNCGTNILISNGGIYNFTNCTVASYSNNYLNKKNPLLVVSNAGFVGGLAVTNNLTANFKNNIFWSEAGIVENETVVNKVGSNAFAVLFQNNIYRNKTEPSNCTLTNNFLNADPLFDSIEVNKRVFDFNISKNSNSPAINKGINTTFISDLNANNRAIGITDIGCYEKQ